MPKRGKNYKAAVAAYNKAELFEVNRCFKGCCRKCESKIRRNS